MRSISEGDNNAIWKGRVSIMEGNEDVKFILDIRQIRYFYLPLIHPRIDCNGGSFVSEELARCLATSNAMITLVSNIFKKFRSVHVLVQKHMNFLKTN